MTASGMCLGQLWHRTDFCFGEHSTQSYTSNTRQGHSVHLGYIVSSGVCVTFKMLTVQNVICEIGAFALEN